LLDDDAGGNIDATMVLDDGNNMLSVPGVNKTKKSFKAGSANKTNMDDMKT